MIEPTLGAVTPGQDDRATALTTISRKPRSSSHPASATYLVKTLG